MGVTLRVVESARVSSDVLEHDEDVGAWKGITATWGLSERLAMQILRMDHDQDRYRSCLVGDRDFPTMAKAQVRRMVRIDHALAHKKQTRALSARKHWLFSVIKGFAPLAPIDILVTGNHRELTKLLRIVERG